AHQDYDYTSDSFNIEHVLPQNPVAGWESFTDEEAEAMTYRLGNMTLMHAGANRDLGNTPYATKRPVLQGSGFALTRKLAEDHADWSPERIEAHQNWMANQATSIWRIAQLGNGGWKGRPHAAD
ncbi:MAG: HNH endonuclease family protein, partial [Prosthecobacter sp.]|nr:HNH endonuclease family protein [Prosthecobacter sp.]